MENSKSTLFVLLMILCGTLSAQDHLYNKVWIYGGNSGIDFSSGSPQPIAAKMKQLEGVASVTGPDGRLLFYTNGATIWNRNHEVMSNGTDLAPYWNGQELPTTRSTSQAAVIVPMPDSAKYYVFSLTQLPGPRLFYSIVDMDLNGCMGGVEPGRRAILFDGIDLSEKMTAVRGNNCNVWLLVHDINKPIFRSYEITNNGINSSPVLSTSAEVPGPADPGYKHDSYVNGVIKVSPDRTKIALASGIGQRIELHDFDAATGKVSGGKVLYEGTEKGYGVCFSPDNSKLYASIGNEICQYNIGLPDLAAIINSRVAISAAVPHSSESLGIDMQLAPDNKIYAGGTASHVTLFTINEPNMPGMGCKFERQLFRWQGDGASFGAPNSLPVLQAKDTVSSSQVVKVTGCFSGTATLTVTEGRDHIWEDNSTCRTRVVDKPGIYIAKYLGLACVYHIDTFIVPDIPVIKYPAACALSNNNVAWFETVAGDTTRWQYNWYNQANELLRTFTGRRGDTLKNIPTGNYSVQLTSITGCKKTMVFTITAPPSITGLPVKDSVCAGEEWVVAPQYSEPIRSWQWNFGDGTTASLMQPAKIFVAGGRSYTVKHSVVSAKGCVAEAFIDVYVHALPVIDAGPDLIVPAGESVMLQASGNSTAVTLRWIPASFLSSDVVLRPVATPPATLSYYLTATDKYTCTVIDSMKLDVLFQVRVPNIFTPNGDGINDVWVIPGLDKYEQAMVQIFNRWGQQVYQSKGYAQPWNGQQAGRPLPAGSYYYVIDLRNKEPVLRGGVTIIR
jgi:gliding motility-associated-like protein